MYAIVVLCMIYDFGMQVKLEFEEEVGGVVRSKVIVG